MDSFGIISCGVCSAVLKDAVRNENHSHQLCIVVQIGAKGMPTVPQLVLSDYSMIILMRLFLLRYDGLKHNLGVLQT